MSPRQIPGDPLTGSLPRTQLIVPQAVLGPIRAQPSRGRDTWPIVPDSMTVTMEQLRPGRIASYRTRRGVRQMLVRVVSVSHERRSRGRHYVVGVTPRGVCRSVWVDRVISVETVQRALAVRRAIEARIAEPKGGGRAAKP